jgi:ATP-dependent DNA helicase RecQ
MSDDTGGTEASAPDSTESRLRDEAERCLRALAGPDARLRDQWTAIRAL